MLAKSLLKRVVRPTFFMLLLPLVLLAALACTPDQAKLLEGLLQNVDGISGEVTIQLKDGGTVTINLEDVDVEALSQGVGAVSLGAGDPVTLELDENDNVTILKAHVTEIEGIITGIDPVAKTVTVNDGDPLTVTIETKIEIDDQDATFEGLSIGQEVEVKHDETGRVLKIEADDDVDIDKGKVGGTLTSVDLAAHTVTIRATNGIEAVYSFQPVTKLKLSDGQVGIFTDLGPLINSEVEARFDRANNNLLKLKVENGHGDGDHGDDNDRGHTGKVEGTLTAVDTVAQSVTIRAEDGAEVTYFVRPSTRLELDDKKGVLADLVPLVGVGVEAKFNRSTNDLFKLEVENEHGDGDHGDGDDDDDKGAG